MPLDGAVKTPSFNSDGRDRRRLNSAYRGDYGVAGARQKFRHTNIDLDQSRANDACVIHQCPLSANENRQFVRKGGGRGRRFAVWDWRDGWAKAGAEQRDRITGFRRPRGHARDGPGLAGQNPIGVKGRSQ